MDGDGNRRNAGQNTFNREWPTVLFIGDSATASLEVDNEHTVPALLESGLRSSGLEYNVVNLGVRGYGTDQSVLKAIRFTGKYDPVAIIYLYDNNDDFDNNALRIPFKAYGKGVFIKRQEDTGFEGIHFDRKYADAEAGLVLLDRDCRAVIHEFQLSDKSVLGAKLARWVQGFGSYLYGGFILPGIRSLYRGDSTGGTEVSGDIDPYSYLQTHPVDWDLRLESAYRDEGALRARCRDYFSAQMSFLLAKLREGTGAQQIHVVAFPHVQTLERLDDGFHSPTTEMFETLLSRASIDSFTDLTADLHQERLTYEQLACRQDYHFCESGNRWIAQKLLETLRLP